MRISDWSSDVCSSDLWTAQRGPPGCLAERRRGSRAPAGGSRRTQDLSATWTQTPEDGEPSEGYTIFRLRGVEIRPAASSAPVAGRLAGGGDAVGGADHHHGEGVGLVELCRDALGLLQGHRLDVAVALVQVVDAEVLELHADQHAGDVVRAVEAQREGAGEVALGGVQLLGGRPLNSEERRVGKERVRASRSRWPTEP